MQLWKMLSVLLVLTPAVGPGVAWAEVNLLSLPSAGIETSSQKGDDVEAQGQFPVQARANAAPFNQDQCYPIRFPLISTENFVAQAGSRLYVAAANLMYVSNNRPVTINTVGVARHLAESFQRGTLDRGEELTAARKAALRPIFGDLVDRVRFYWGANLTDNATLYVPNVQRDVQLRFGDTAAMTFGTRIYIHAQDPGQLDRDTMCTVIHEMVHSRQYEILNSRLAAFGHQYFGNFALVNFQYEPNCMEVEARDVSEFQATLDGAMERYRAALR